MSEEAKRDPGACREVETLVVWWPGGGPGAAERRLVEAHVALCDACAGLLRLARELRRIAAQHPEPQRLVQAAEDESALAPGERAELAAHVALCDACTAEMDILRAVDETDAAVRSPAGAASGTHEAGVGELLGGFRRRVERWLGPAWRPQPAALIAAGLAAALLLVIVRPAGHLETSPTGARLGGVVLLADGAGVLRAGAPPEPAPVIDGSRERVLLIELTRLAAPPEPGARYRVTISRPGGGTPVIWQGEVQGAVFRENYSLTLTLPAGTLAAGLYAIVVSNPRGRPVFNSALRVE